jgi:hypothetical protein
LRIHPSEAPFEADSLASMGDLPALALPDYPTLTPITPPTPSP